VITEAMRAGRSVVADRSVALSFISIHRQALLIRQCVSANLDCYGYYRWRWGLLEAGCLTFF
jgi:hypothetical protein